MLLVVQPAFQLTPHVCLNPQINQTGKPASTYPLSIAIPHQACTQCNHQLGRSHSLQTAARVPNATRPPLNGLCNTPYYSNRASTRLPAHKQNILSPHNHQQRQQVMELLPTEFN